MFKETFRSPFEKNTKEEALKTLEAIRADHPSSKGWKETSAEIEELPNGKYRAVRKHYKE